MHPRSADHALRTTHRLLPPRRDPAVLAIAAAWRALTGTPKGKLPATLLAVSGGADSTALLLAMAAIDPDAVIAAHIIHDMRPPHEANADAQHVANLCHSINITLHTAHASIKPDPNPPTSNTRSSNAEANARRARYQQLTRIATQNNIQWIATAHHADDQLETLIMALIRGAAHTGLRGIAPKRQLTPPNPSTSNQPSHPVHLIRPMLTITRDDAERLCNLTNNTWCNDITNTDLSRTRAAVRAQILPILKAIAPAAPKRAAETANILRSVTNQLRQDAANLDEQTRISPQNPEITTNQSQLSRTWQRQPLAKAEPALLGQLLRDTINSLAANTTSNLTANTANHTPPKLDNIPQRALTALHRALADNTGGHRTLNLGPHTATITKQTLTLTLNLTTHATPQTSPPSINPNNRSQTRIDPSKSNAQGS